MISAQPALDIAFATWGNPATLTVGVTPYQLTAIDLSKGLQLPGLVEVETERPSAAVRVAEYNGLGLTVNAATIDGASLLLNGTTWKVLSYEPMPSPNGLSDGMLLLRLQGPAES